MSCWIVFLCDCFETLWTAVVMIRMAEQPHQVKTSPKCDPDLNNGEKWLAQKKVGFNDIQQVLCKFFAHDVQPCDQVWASQF